MTIQEIVRAFLDEHQLTYRGLAELLSATYPITAGAIGQWMTGETVPSALRLTAYCNATDERVKKLASDLLSAVTPATIVDPICIQDSTE